MRAGKILKKATNPLGVLAGTRSRAADKMMTYSTNDDMSVERAIDRDMQSTHRCLASQK